MLSIYGDEGKIPAIYATPDPVYMRKTVGNVFEIPGELSRKALDPDVSQETRDRYLFMIHKQYAAPAVRVAEDNQRLVGWQIISVDPKSLQPCFTQEDAEDIIVRTKEAGKTKDVPKAARIRALERDTVFWQVDMLVQERAKMFSRYRETLGPDQGFESIDLVPAWFNLKGGTIDTKGRQN